MSLLKDHTTTKFRVMLSKEKITSNTILMTRWVENHVLSCGHVRRIYIYVFILIETNQGGL